MAAQRDTIRYAGVSQYDYLLNKVSDMQYNIGMYAAKREAAFVWMGVGLGTSMAISGHNLNADNPKPVLYVIPAAMSIVGIVKLIGAEKYLRNIEISGGGVKIKF